MKNLRCLRITFLQSCSELFKNYQLKKFGEMLPLCNQIANFTYTDINYEAIPFSYFSEGLKLNAVLRKMHLTISINCKIDEVQAFSMIQMFDHVKSEQIELDFS
jgi:hypothetical protein